LRIVDDRVVSKMFGPKTDDKTGDWRKLHTEERHVLYSSPTITQVIKSRRMRWAGHVTRIGEKKGAYRILVQKREGERERDYMEDVGVGGWIILKWILKIGWEGAD